MAIKDSFKYEARWDSVGLDCSFCRHFSGPDDWPDTARVSSCSLHRVSLAIEVADSGYKNMEWFCRDFTDTGRAHPAAVAHLNEIREELESGMLYRFYGEDGFLVEHRMAEFKMSDDPA